MNALLWTHRESGFFQDASAPTSPPLERVAHRTSSWTLLVILTAFWIYVAMSNVLYANSMQASFATAMRERMFATWDVRLLQHFFLFPAFVSCVFASVRLGWHTLSRKIWAQLLLAVFFSALACPLLALAEYLLGDSQYMGHPWRILDMFNASELPSWIASATNFFLTYGFGVALATGFTFYRRMRDSELRATAMEQAWSAARLSALRMQLSPHTLFNLLNTIRGHIAWDPTTAQSMVVQFADLLRQLLNAGEREYSRLADELKFARLYLELQQKRFADRLTVTLPPPDAIADAWVPSLILQPLIENAVVHGLAHHHGPVEIAITFAITEQQLELQVTNSFAGQTPADHEGIGLRNVAERLCVQFGAQAQFSSGPGAGSNWVAVIRMPVLHELQTSSAPKNSP